MEKLLSEVNVSVTNEYNRTAAKFGYTNNSAHESYAVILEEFDEAQSEANSFERCLRGYWNGVKANTVTKCQLQQLQQIAERAAAEWIQVAAMCNKATIRKDAQKE